MQKITPFLWFDNQAEEAVNFYVSIFKNSKILNSARYNKESAKVSGRKEGSVMVINFSLNGQEFAALNGGKVSGFEFSSATSFVINCTNQKEVDHFWEKLLKGGRAQQCGWLTDKYGVTWQVVPVQLSKYLGGKNKEGAQRAMVAMLKMQKLDVNALKQAHDGT